MDYGFWGLYITAHLAFFGLVLGVPLFLLRLFSNWLASRSQEKPVRLVRFFSMAWSLCVGYLVYTSIYPTDDFYEQEFQAITGLSFPASGSISAKDADSQDTHGDYSACAVVELSPSDYQILQQTLAVDTTFAEHNFATDSTFIASIPFRTATRAVPDSAYATTYSAGVVNINVYRFIGFLKDRKTIIVYRCSS